MPAQETSIGGVVRNTTIEIRRSNVGQWTKFGSLISGATILLLTDEELFAVRTEYDALMQEIQNHYGSRGNLVHLLPPIQAAFNKLLNATARYRLQRDGAR